MANGQRAERADRFGRRARNGAETNAGVAANSVLVSRIPGIHANANFTTHTGTDDRALIQAVMDSLSEQDGITEIVFDKPVAIRGGLKYHSNMRLRGINGGGLLLLPRSGEVNNFILRNDEPPQVTYNGNGNPSYTVAYPTHDVTISDLYLDGNRARNSAGSRDPRQPQGQLQSSALGQNVFGLCAYGVTNLTLRNVTVHDSPTYAYHLATVQHVTVDGCRAEVGGTRDNPTVIYNSNQDGLHVNGPASDLRITRFSGTTGDDLIALNANDGHQSGPAPRRLYSAWNDCVWHGDITDVTIDGSRMENCLFGFRLLAITDVIDRIRITNTTGGSYQNPLQIDIFPGIGPQTGHVGTVLIDGWDLNAPVWDRGRLNGGVGSGGVNPPVLSETPNDNIDAANAMFRLGGKIDALTVRNIRRSGQASARPLIYVNDRFEQTNIRQLTLDGLTIADDDNADAPATQVYIAAPFGSHTPAIGTLKVANVTWPGRSARQRGRLVQVNGGNITSLQLSDVTAGNIAHLVDISGTKQTRVGALQTARVRIEGARANDEAFVSAGATVDDASLSGVTTQGRVAGSNGRFRSARGNAFPNGGNGGNGSGSNGNGGSDRAVTLLSETFTGTAGNSLSNTNPAQHGGVGRATWKPIGDGGWDFTGDGSVRSNSSITGALVNLPNVGANVTVRATFKTGNANAAQIVLRSNPGLTGYIAVNLDPANGVKVYDLGESGNPLPNVGGAIAANVAHSVVIVLRGSAITVTVDDNPPITNTVSSRNTSNTNFGIRGYGSAGVEFRAFSVSNR